MYNILEKLVDTGEGIYEIVLDGGDMMDLSDLLKLNRAGYVCIKTVYDVDYEDEDEDGNIIKERMDIHYFGKVNVKQFTELMDL